MQAPICTTASFARWSRKPRSEVRYRNQGRRACDRSEGLQIVASGFVDAAMREALGTANRASLDIIDGSPRGISLVIDPSCNVVGEVLSEHEGILYADIDTEKGVEPKQFHDVVGYYNRFDIFNLTIDRTPLEPAHFVDAPAADSATPDHARPGQLENGQLSLRDVDGFGALS